MARWRLRLASAVESLTATRRMVGEAPKPTGMRCGSPNFFRRRPKCTRPSDSHTVTALSTYRRLTEQNLRTFGRFWFTGRLPDWLPTRPLLIGYLKQRYQGTLMTSKQLIEPRSIKQQHGVFCSISYAARSGDTDFCAPRDDKANHFTSRATLARARGDQLGPIDMDQMERALCRSQRDSAR